MLPYRHDSFTYFAEDAYSQYDHFLPYTMDMSDSSFDPDIDQNLLFHQHETIDPVLPAFSPYSGDCNHVAADGQLLHAFSSPAPDISTRHVPFPMLRSLPAFSALPEYAFDSIFESLPSPTPQRLSTSSFVRRRSSPGRGTRSVSLISTASSLNMSTSEISRSTSPNAGEMAKWGTPDAQGGWICSFPGCTSRSVFRRGCDLRKHYRRHTKSLFCRESGCPQAIEGGFSSKKDRARHEAKHDPQIACECSGCDRLFSRVDNMVSCTRFYMYGLVADMQLFFQEGSRSTDTWNE